MMNWLAWIACVSGVIGAALVAFNCRLSRYGFVPLLVASVCWAICGLQQHLAPLAWMSVVHTFIALIGILRWWLPQRATRVRIALQSRSRRSQAIFPAPRLALATPARLRLRVQRAPACSPSTVAMTGFFASAGRAAVR